MVRQTIFTFHTMHFAMKAQKAFKDAQILYETTPVPKEISADCGICLRTSLEVREEAYKILDRNNVTIGQIYELGEA